MSAVEAHTCDNGWVQVGAAWVEKQLEKLPTDFPEHLIASRRAALADTWYPCQSCNPRQFMRWVQGHWSGDHDAATCGECVALGVVPSPRGPRRHRPTKMEVERPPHPAASPAPYIDPDEQF